MWGLQNPLSVFDYVNLGYDRNADFQMIAILKKSKYLSFSVQDRNQLEVRLNNNLQMLDAQIKSPNNPMELVPAKIISYKK
jgi:hypothetical protein